eukprot:s4125_g2.t1
MAAGEAASDMSLYSGTHCRADLQFSDAVIWEPVPFLPGHWIVNLGTDLFRWAAQSSSQSSLCRPCKATLHRVVPITGTTDRYSMPFFYEPNLDVRDPYPPHTARHEYLIRDAADGPTRTSLELQPLRCADRTRRLIPVTNALRRRRPFAGIPNQRAHFGGPELNLAVWRCS